MAATSTAGAAESAVLKAGTVLIQHRYNLHLRIHPENQSKANGNGGHGIFARWSLEVHGQNVVKFKNLKSGKYLRIISIQNGTTLCDVGGNGGKFTIFKYDPIQRTLESRQFPGCYLAMNPQHKSTVFAVQRKNKVNTQSTVEFAFDFNIIYLDDQNPVVIRHGFGRSLRVNPENEGAICGHGQKGKFARWTMEKFAASSNNTGCIMVRFRSIKSGKALRIVQKGTVVDVRGGSGPFTTFKYDAMKHTLESVQFPGTFLCVRKGDKSVIAVRQSEMAQNEKDISMRFELLKVQRKQMKKPCLNGKRRDDQSTVIENQRRLIQQQQRLITQLQKTVDTQQQMISQLTGQNPGGVVMQNQTPQTNMNDDGEWDADDNDGFEHVTVPGATKE